MNPILIALQFLTRLPVKPGSYQDLDLKSSLYWYGLAGFIIGAILYGFFVGCTLLLPNLSHSVLAVLLLGIWVFITGALHLDGLADSADAWLGGLTKEKALTIMKDPRSGPAGVVATVLLLLLKFACLESILATNPAALILVPALARGFMPLLFLHTPYARGEGLGQHFSDGLSGSMVAVQLGLITLAGFLITGWATVIVLLVMGLVYLWLRRLMLQRIEGTTGDTAGAMIEILEAVALLAFIA